MASAAGATATTVKATYTWAQPHVTTFTAAMWAGMQPRVVTVASAMPEPVTALLPLGVSREHAVLAAAAVGALLSCGGLVCCCRRRRKRR